MSPEDNQLALQLAKRIEASGPISVADYMRASNEAYYDREDPLGVDGDFITAPEVSQIFGELVGLWFADLWLRMNSPANVNWVELGPGRGTLSADALRAMAKFEFTPPVHFVETSTALKAKQAAAVPSALFHENVDTLPDEGPLLIIANEFFDALPVRQMVATHAGWRERVVVRDRGSKFMAMPGQHPMDDLIPADFRSAPANSIYETSPDSSAVMYELASRIANQGGALLIIDYGYPQPGLGSTLQSLKSHKFVEPFEDPGARDLTAHVNFLEIANLARMRDLRINGPVEQGQWLTALGVNERAAALAEAAPDKADDIIAARKRLVDGAEMGSLFKVLSISSPDWPEPEGFRQTLI